jgi:hypothetical protein
MEPKDITILIKNRFTGALCYTSLKSFGLLTNANEWEIVRPEQQFTPEPQGKTIRAETLSVELPGPEITTNNARPDETPQNIEAEKPKTRRRRK